MLFIYFRSLFCILFYFILFLLYFTIFYSKPLYYSCQMFRYDAFLFFILGSLSYSNDDDDDENQVRLCQYINNDTFIRFTQLRTKL
jgi:hypothetical protein